MKYQGSPTFTHRQADKIGVLLTNLGTPDAPTTSALRTYLGEFLADPRVVEFPRLLWRVILHGIILRVRPRRSAAAYRTVWTAEGSPLLTYTQAQANAVRVQLQQKFGQDVVVEFAMRYGNPSIPSVLESMLQQGVRKLVVLPLYPQYSASTTASTFDKISQDFVRRRWLPELRFMTHYHDFPPFVEAAAQHIEHFWETNGRADKLMFSYHGVPLRYLKQGDPYHCQCHKTSRLIAERLGLGADEYLTTFQSRFGREEWLKPYTDETMKQLPGQGVKSLQVFCPGFAADCLETIEEIGEENRDYFLEAGGEKFAYIPALNDSPAHIDALTQLLTPQLQQWLPVARAQDIETRAKQALALGASD